MQDLPSIELRPGVRRPDWSVVTKPVVRDALLRKASSRPGLFAKWSTKLEPNQDLVWRTVIEDFAATGRAPRLKEIAPRLNMPEQQLLPLLRELCERDLLGLNATSDAIVFAYPFTDRDTGHAVELQGPRVHALCVIDALGAGAMCGVDALIESSCRLCSVPIKILTSRTAKLCASHPRSTRSCGTITPTIRVLLRHAAR